MPELVAIGDETTHVAGARLNPLIATQGLSKDYSLGDHTVHALPGVSVAIQAGEMVAPP